MPELDPATLAERVLRLSRSPPFDLMPVEDVTVLAAVGREQSFPSRTVLARAGERTMAHYVPLAGRLRLSDAPLIEKQVTHGGVGALSVLGNVVLPSDLVAEAGSVLLVLDRDALLDVLEEHGHVARTVLRLLAMRLLEFRKNSAPAVPPRPPPTVRLDLVSRMLTLRDALGLGSDGMATVARLARVARARQFAAGEAVFDGQRPADVLVLLEGSLQLKGPGATERIARPGEVLGLAEAVAGVPIGLQATARTEASALILSHQELAEDIEDEDALCIQFIRAFSAQLWREIAGTGPWRDVAQEQEDTVSVD